MSTSTQVLTVLGGKKVAVEGVVYSSLTVGFMADDEDNESEMYGFQTAKMSCEPQVVDALPQGDGYPMHLTVNVKNKIKSGAMTTHVLSIVTEKTVASKPAK
ncbi:hypothetical protein A3759_25820 [Thalassolituus sp. HI0120]|jgi:hypothetical protein|nr:hypothetical protein A3759_03780 [Thalassolituus sp. HI0120]KZZ50067.1 hypothetical protein A3759_25820 [Thalassolituus sp. HI0120]